MPRDFLQHAKNEYDVIGSGLAGLTAANVLVMFFVPLRMESTCCALSMAAAIRQNCSDETAFFS